jgi:glucokinase
MYLGIDLGGTKIALGIIDEQGHVHESQRIPTHRSRPFEAVIEDIITLGNRLINSQPAGSILGAGIGVPGPVDSETGQIINCINLGWKTVPIQDMLSRGLRLPTFAGNDATMAGIAEFEAGVLMGVKTGVLLTLGTGIGGAVICEGQIQHGAHNIASEIGHMIVGENFYNCSCGRNGCLETFSSATALVKYTRKLLSGNSISILPRGNSRNQHNRINGTMIFDAAKSGDPVASRAVDRVAKYLAIGIVNIVAVIDPERIVIGGGMSKAGDFFLEKIKKEAEHYRYFKEMPIGDIVYGKFGQDAGLIGAGLYAGQRLGMLNKGKE